MVKITWIQNAESADKAGELAGDLNMKIIKGDLATPRGSYYKVDKPPQKDVKLPVKKNLPGMGMMAVYFVDPTVEK